MMTAVVAVVVVGEVGIEKLCDEEQREATERAKLSLHSSSWLLFC